MKAQTIPKDSRANLVVRDQLDELAIVLNGKLVKRAALDAMLTEAEAAAAK